MTCIVAITDGTKVYMGGDSAAVDEQNAFITTRKEPKVFIRNNYIVGYAGSFRFGKIVEHSFSFPDVDCDDLDRFMNTTFVTSLRDCVDSLKLDFTSEEKDTGELLIGINGRIFELNTDWHVGEDSNSYNSIGSGAPYALGSLYSTRRKRNPYSRIDYALNAAEKFSAYVKSPFIILEK